MYMPQIRPQDNIPVGHGGGDWGGVLCWSGCGRSWCSRRCCRWRLDWQPQKKAMDASNGLPPPTGSIPAKPFL